MERAANTARSTCRAPHPGRFSQALRAQGSLGAFFGLAAYFVIFPSGPDGPTDSGRCPGPRTGHKSAPPASGAPPTSPGRERSGRSPYIIAHNGHDHRVTRAHHTRGMIRSRTRLAPETSLGHTTCTQWKDEGPWQGAPSETSRPGLATPCRYTRCPLSRTPHLLLALHHSRHRCRVTTSASPRANPHNAMEKG